MNFTSTEIKKLMLPVALALLLAGAGAALIWYVNRSLINDNVRLTAAKNSRVEVKARLERISEEEREVKERIEVYRRLRNLHVIGQERRLEWVDAIQRIRVDREMLDVRYQIAPRKQISLIDGKPGKVAFYSSEMKVELALLHEGDLLAFLNDLRKAGNAFVSARRCVINRAGGGAPPPGAPTLAPRLRAECFIDLITIVDPGAKT